MGRPEGEALDDALRNAERCVGPQGEQGDAEAAVPVADDQAYVQEQLRSPGIARVPVASGTPGVRGRAGGDGRLTAVDKDHTDG